LSLWEVRVAWREPLAVWGSIQLVQAVPEDWETQRRRPLGCRLPGHPHGKSLWALLWGHRPFVS
jgi:hypothetical protein